VKEETMKSTYLAAALAVALVTGSRAFAAQPEPQPSSTPAVLEGAPEGMVVRDNDGGRVQIVPRARLAEGGKKAPTNHGGPVVAKATLQAVFLGSAWREAANRTKESRVLDALGEGVGGRAAKLSRYGIAGEEAPTALQEDLLDPLETNSVSDLEIQRRLAKLLPAGSMRASDASTVYVFFLAPGLVARLGATSSEKDFVAYHNFFRAEAGVVHYSVVAYDDQFSRWLANAERSVLQTLMNPEGTGWY
jgi:hypothetical protein